MNMTVQRLRQMKPGDHLQADIKRSRDVPQYREILEEVSATARELEKKGWLTLSERPVKVEVKAAFKNGAVIKRRIPIVEYVAVAR